MPPQAERQRRWYLNRTPEQREARRVRQRLASMGEEQRERARERKRAWEERHITVSVYDGKLRVPRTPENEEAVEKLLAKRDAFRAHQQVEEESLRETLIVSAEQKTRSPSQPTRVKLVVRVAARGERPPERA